MTRDVVTVNAEDGLCKAQRLMDKYSIGCLPVVDDSRIVGIVTSKDIRNSHPNRIVADAMSRKVIFVTPDISVWDARQKMEKHKIERLLVLNKEKLVGVVTRAKLYYELGKHTDLLTGLYKAEYVYQKAVELLEGGVEISFIFIDMDRFGYINKEYGHTTGNMILKEMAGILKRVVSQKAYLCRFGGDEFVILDPNGADQSRIIAENFLKEVSGTRFYKDIKVSASVGIAGNGNYENKEGSHIKSVMEMINTASLASTKAKKEKHPIIVAEGAAVSEIA
ncbi:GGDEF domain-containing protein [Anaerobacterium chartisolvens]|nr:GGDEF domain-containing protein [Anaerobacterium chartisolvens]